MRTLNEWLALIFLSGLFFALNSHIVGTGWSIAGWAVVVVVISGTIHLTKARYNGSTSAFGEFFVDTKAGRSWVLRNTNRAEKADWPSFSPPGYRSIYPGKSFISFNTIDDVGQLKLLLHLLRQYLREGELGKAQQKALDIIEAIENGYLKRQTGQGVEEVISEFVLSMENDESGKLAAFLRSSARRHDEAGDSVSVEDLTAGVSGELAARLSAYELISQYSVNQSGEGKDRKTTIRLRGADVKLDDYREDLTNFTRCMADYQLAVEWLLLRTSSSIIVGYREISGGWRPMNRLMEVVVAVIDTTPVRWKLKGMDFTDPGGQPFRMDTVFEASVSDPRLFVARAIQGEGLTAEKTLDRLREFAVMNLETFMNRVLTMSTAAVWTSTHAGQKVDLIMRGQPIEVVPEGLQKLVEAYEAAITEAAKTAKDTAVTVAGDDPVERIKRQAARLYPNPGIFMSPDGSHVILYDARKGLDALAKVRRQNHWARWVLEMAHYGINASILDPQQTLPDVAVQQAAAAEAAAEIGRDMAEAEAGRLERLQLPKGEWGRVAVLVTETLSRSFLAGLNTIAAAVRSSDRRS